MAQEPPRSFLKQKLIGIYRHFNAVILVCISVLLALSGAAQY